MLNVAAWEDKADLIRLSLIFAVAFQMSTVCTAYIAAWDHVMHGHHISFSRQLLKFGQLVRSQNSGANSTMCHGCSCNWAQCVCVCACVRTKTKHVIKHNKSIQLFKDILFKSS